jgi:uncharacterized GH25 family protein
MRRSFLRGIAAALAATAVVARAHDTWLQTATTVVRPADVVHVDLALGNHGNDHRDFKYAGKLASLDGGTVEVIAPAGTRHDLAPEMIDLGYAAKEGFWSARFVPAAEGLHTVAHRLDRIRETKRSVKSAKTFFVVAEKLDREPKATAEHATPLGHDLELVAETHPVIGMGPGRPIAVRLLFKGRPLADERVSFIPRGATLAEGFDPKFERRTDAEGRCRWETTEGTYVLVVAHREEPAEKGAGYETTKYSATLVVNVPGRCPCCE